MATSSIHDVTSTLPPRLAEITVRDGRHWDGPEAIGVNLGDEVILRVTSDQADEVHIHGYDLKVEVGTGETVDLSFVADVPGIFEVELENSGIKIFEIEVTP